MIRSAHSSFLPIPLCMRYEFFQQAVKARRHCARPARLEDVAFQNSGCGVAGEACGKVWRFLLFPDGA